MPSYSGKFAYLDEKGGALAPGGACQLAFDEESCTVTPASGTPLAFDLGDVDRLSTWPAVAVTSPISCWSWVRAC